MATGVSIGGRTSRSAKSLHRVDQNPWNGELKLIGGWRDERWTLAANVNVDFVVSGPDPAPASVEIATKVGYKVAPNVTLGLESYNGVGTFSSFGHFDRNDHASFLTADFALGRWDFDAGIGKGYGTNADSTILKFVIGVPIG